VKDVLLRTGHVVTLRSALEPDAAADLGSHDAVIIGAAIHRGNHHKAVARLVRKHIALLRSRPNAFFSVSLSAAGDARQRGIATGMMEKFLTATDWRPHEATIFAGALQYRQYHLPLRLMMRFIATFAGRDTDSSRDYEYTDWAEVEGFATRFGARIPAAKAA
jgi:menaquinone-dependent protoporphyrinogen oxidase